MNDVPKVVVPGTNTLLMGETGTGKTHILGSIADSDVELFVIFVEENGLESLLRYWRDRDKPVPPNVHWHVLPRIQNTFGALEESAKAILNSSIETLHKIPDYDRAKYNSLVKLLAALNDFPDDRTGQRFGSVAAWGPNRCLALDSLTGLGSVAFTLVVGKKPVKSQPEWAVAQDQVERLVRECCGCNCHFVLTAHIERETDTVSLTPKITVATLGRALPPKIPRMFNDVILTVRNGAEFTWSTAATGVAVKACNLPIAEKLTPGFPQLYNRWRSLRSKLNEV